jgi:cbb3-type cytochrome oxidase subunit 3
MTATLTVEKATYDMSGVSIANKTVTYNGEAHSIAIIGTLPNGVTVTYTGNGKTDAGVYTVVASFAGDANYNAIADMTATLTIKAVVFEDTEKDEETGKPVVKVESDNGFDPNTELVVEVVAVEIETSEIRVEMAENEEIAVAYDVSLMQDGVSVQPNGIIRIKMLIPTNLLGAQFRIVHIHDGEEIGDVDYTVDDIYAVVETDKLSAFVFVGENDGADLDSNLVFIIIGIVLLFLIVLLIILYFVYRAYRERKEEYEERKYTEKQNKKQ